MRSHIIASVALALMLPTTGAVLAAAPAQASSAQKPPAFEEPDQARVDAQMADGLGAGSALFLALTTVKAKVVGDHRAKITESFPTGNTAVIGVSAVPKSTPGALKVTSDTSGGKLAFTLKYSVPIDAIPADARPGGTQALGDVGAAPAVAASYTSAALQAEPTVYEVLVTGLVNQFRDDKVDDLIKYLGKELGAAESKLDKLVGALRAGLAVADAMALSKDFDAYKAKLDALEECAKNPTNQVTTKNNSEHPGDLERILKEISDARETITGNTAAGYIGKLNATAAGLIKAAPWLAYVIGPGTSWADGNFKEVNDRLIKALENLVTPCANDIKVDATVETLWHVTGIKCGGPAGDWELDGSLIGTETSGTEHITFTLPKESLSGTATTQTDIVIPVIGGTRSTTTPNPVKYAKTSDTSGILTHGGVAIPVTVGRFCTEVASGP